MARKKTRKKRLEAIPRAWVWTPTRAGWPPGVTVAIYAAASGSSVMPIPYGTVNRIGRISKRMASPKGLGGGEATIFSILPIL
jgi:hypothetical protein